ncbi:PhoH family protein, partial [Shewanella sp. 0m-11]
MSNKLTTLNLYLEPAETRRLASLCGPFDDNIKQLERRIGVEISYRNNHFQIVGTPRNCLTANNLLRNLYIETQPLKGSTPDLEPDAVHIAIQEAIALEMEAPRDDSELFIKTKRGVIKPRNPNQSDYVRNIVTHDITFGIGPAGTGKTYLAVAAAVDALERQEVRRILLTRPAVEAGEKLGFLPGDLSQKVDP